MRGATRHGLILFGLVIGTFLAQFEVRRLFHDPFPRFDQLPAGPYDLEDAGIVACGFRSVAADVAYVQFLAYLGGPQLPIEDPKRNYDLLGTFALRVTRTNPYFRRAYVESAGILAWFKGIDRPDEAIEILEEGIPYNPDYWPLRSYIAAIGYKKADKFDKMTQMLEQAIRDPGCPLLLKEILAGAYKSHRRYRDAIRIWLTVVNDPRAGESSVERAKRSIADIEQLAAQRNRK